MVKLHLKRLASPNTWPIPKKTITFVARPHPGPHKLEHQIPISVFLRDMVGLLDSQKEVKYILHTKQCLVDGRVCHDNKRPVGILDVVSLPKAKKHFRVSISRKNKLVPVEIPEKEASVKVCKIMGKSSIKKGRTQLSTLDGRTFIVDDATSYSVGDSIVINIPEQEIKDHLPLKTGATIFLDAGRHVGVVGTVEDIDNDIVVVKAGEDAFRTKRAYAVVVGKNKPVITVDQNE